MGTAAKVGQRCLVLDRVAACLQSGVLYFMGVPKKSAKPKLPTLDLRSITPHPDKCRTVVRVELSFGETEHWIKLGQTEIRKHQLGNRSHENGWRLEARIPGATDGDHSAAYAIRLPLIGLHFEGILAGFTRFVAWVDPSEEPEEGDDHSDFNVPPPDYDPRKHPQAVACPRCKGSDKHVFLPDGYRLYVPPFDPELYQAVRGKRVEILVGPVFKDE